MRFIMTLVAAIVLPLAVVFCDPGSEPALLTLPMVADGSGLETFTTDEGFEIELTSMRVALRDFEMTIGGETHSDASDVLRRALVPVALAHPGHYAGGEVTGELPGRFIIDFFAGGDVPLGDASLLEGDYEGLNFTFRSADDEDGLAAGDPLLGHTFALAGRARRDDQEVSFDAVLDVDEDTQMVGAPFELAARPGTTATLVLRFLPVDPSEGDTAFDGVDFFAGADEGELEIAPGSEEHNVIRRRIQVHDHWWVETRE